VRRDERVDALRDALHAVIDEGSLRVHERVDCLVGGGDGAWSQGGDGCGGWSMAEVRVCVCVM
jgi:hypothetical protein